MTPRRSLAWWLAFKAAYAFLRVIDPLLRWMWFSVGLGITARLTVPGRRTGRERSVLVGLIRLDRRWYAGHPNGEVGWTANLRSAGTARIAPIPEESFDIEAELFPPGAGARRRHPRRRGPATLPGEPALSGRAQAHPE